MAMGMTIVTDSDVNSLTHCLAAMECCFKVFDLNSILVAHLTRVSNVF